ncbi:MAG: 6,7-dimethyl-8-ribityllumazine synthase [Bacteroidota bacterium]
MEKKKNLSEYNTEEIGDLSEVKFGLIVADWNPNITHSMFDAAKETLLKHGAKEDNLEIIQVPGTFELPAAARILIKRKAPDAIICIGCVIKGETAHNEYISNAVAQGLVQLSLVSGVPCIFGVLTPNDMEQAKDRAGGKHGNKGVEAAYTAIRMAELYKGEKKNKKIGF